MPRPEDGRTHCRWRGLVKDPDDVSIVDSLLSEEAVMAFEYGYARRPAHAQHLEGLFGDFAKTAPRS
jgi:2-oxoglutarate dehydrogenase E1 component